MVMTMMWQCHLSSSECRCYRLNGFSLFKRLPIPLSSGSRTLEQSVGEWLESLGLQQYESKLLLNGFDDVRFLVSARATPAPPRPALLELTGYIDLSPREEVMGSGKAASVTHRRLPPCPPDLGPRAIRASLC